MIRTLSLLVLTAAFVFTLGCKEQAGGPTATPAPPTKTEGVSPAPVAPRPPAGPVVKLSASHILLQYQGSRQAKPTQTRTKDQALAEIKKIEAELKAGADFATVAKAKSDCPSAQKGGDLGIFRSDRMIPEFSAAVQQLKDGEISGVVETAFGFHLIKRQKVDEIRARHILVMHKESARVPPMVTRTKDEAKQRIAEVKAKLAAGTDFARLAEDYSDCPSKMRGGDLGAFGRGRMAGPFEDAAFKLAENEVSGIVETEFGFHVIQRLPLDAPRPMPKPMTPPPPPSGPQPPPAPKPNP